MDIFLTAMISLCIELGPLVLMVAVVPFVLLGTALIFVAPLFYVKKGK